MRRARAGRRTAAADPRRADVGAGRGGGRTAARARVEAPRAGRRDPLRLAPPRRDRGAGRRVACCATAPAGRVRATVRRPGRRGDAGRAGGRNRDHAPARPGATVVHFRARGCSPQRAVRPRAAPGEVLGITGLIGAGKSELLGALFGAAPAVRRPDRARRHRARAGHPAEAIAPRRAPRARGPRARRPCPGWSVRANATLRAPAALRQPRRRDERAEDGGDDRPPASSAAGPEAPIE